MKIFDPTGELTRRDMLLKTVFGAGMLGLRSLATGLPTWFLANPRRALAQGLPAPCTTSPNAQFLILATSGQGDPVNANVPGMYGDSGISHPTDPTMAATSLTLNGTSTTAAAPWATLPQTVLDRTCFFHHGTYTLIHPDEPKVLALMGITANNEMLCSMISAQLASCLGSIQSQPVALGQEQIMYQGQPLPLLPPSALAATLTSPTGPLTQLQSLRDQDLDALNALVKSEGNPTQQAFIDQYALSQTQVRSLSQSLLGQLASIPDNTPPSQLAAALILIQMNVSPVVVVHLDWGGDNHSDPNLANETSQTVTTLSQLVTFFQNLTTLGLENRVSLAVMNVFGRTLSTKTSTNGRGHQGNHHCTVMIGQPFQGGIIGGVEPYSGDYRAESIDSTSGAGVPNGGGDIPFTETLAAMALTLGTGLGVDPTWLSQNITGGQVVNAALSG
jgi:hypothetical protein